MFFSIRILAGCFSSLLASYWCEVLISSLLLTLEEKTTTESPEARIAIPIPTEDGLLLPRAWCCQEEMWAHLDMNVSKQRDYLFPGRLASALPSS